MMLVLAAWLIAAVVCVALMNLAKWLVGALSAEIGELPEPDICPGCDGYLDFDDDGSNICQACGLTWWKR
jgi:hypothetical protein